MNIRAAVVGAGTMGRGIAMCFANAGIPVRLKDTKQDALAASMKAIEAIYDGKRNPQPDPEVEAPIERAAHESGTTRRSIPSEEIVERTIYALVNEGARILEEGYALRASDIDLVYINGYGFPAHRGGPMRYADEVGAHVVYN